MKVRLSEIDALRGMAALVVAFVFHQHYLTGQFQSGPLDTLPLFAWLHQNGWVAVDLFFVISGFIFAYIYLDSERLKVTGRQFFWARFARLYPLHLAALLLCAGILSFGKPYSATYVDNGWWNFILNLFMLQESGLQTAKSFNVPAWSISVEIMCYTAFYWIASRLRPHIYRVSALLAIGGLLVTISDSSTIDHVGRGFCGYFSGVILYRFRDAPRDRVLLACVIGALFVFLVPIFSLGAVFGITIFPALVFLALGINSLRHPLFVWLGDRSYAIYMLHIPVYMAINVLVFGSEPVPTDLVWPTIVFAWLSVLLLSDLSFRFIEVPLRDWLRTIPQRSGQPGLARPRPQETSGATQT